MGTSRPIRDLDAVLQPRLRARLLADAGLSPQDWREAYLLYLRFQQDLRLIVYRAQQRAAAVGEAQPKKQEGHDAGAER